MRIKAMKWAQAQITAALGAYRLGHAKRERKEWSLETETKKLLESADRPGSVPAFTTTNMIRIAQGHCITDAGSMDPKKLIEEIRRRAKG